MSLPFSIGDIVEIDEKKIFTEPELAEFLGRKGKVETMGISWVKISFEDNLRNFIVSSDKLRKVEDEDTHRF
jgi:hypothetical protein